MTPPEKKGNPQTQKKTEKAYLFQTIVGADKAPAKGRRKSNTPRAVKTRPAKTRLDHGWKKREGEVGTNHFLTGRGAFPPTPPEKKRIKRGEEASYKNKLPIWNWALNLS